MVPLLFVWGLDKLDQREVSTLDQREVSTSDQRRSRPARPTQALCRASDTMSRVTPGTWSRPGESAAVWPGRTWPLGVDWGEEATNVAIHAPEATRMWFCVFDDADAETRHELTEVSLGIWHGAIPGVAPGTRYGFRADGPWQPGLGLRFNPEKLLLDPYARAVSGRLARRPRDLRLPRRGAGHPGPPRQRAVRPEERGGPRPRLRLGRRPEAVRPVARHRHLRAAREGDDRAARPGARAPARHVRRAGRRRR